MSECAIAQLREAQEYISELEQQLSAMTKKVEERDALISMQAEVLKDSYLVIKSEKTKLALSASADCEAFMQADRIKWMNELRPIACISKMDKVYLNPKLIPVDYYLRNPELFTPLYAIPKGD